MIVNHMIDMMDQLNNIQDFLFAAYLLNRVPIKVEPKIPYELQLDKKSSLKRLDI